MKKITVRKINWKIVIFIAVYAIAFIYVMYSIIGMAFGPIKQKANGNYCQGYDYGIKFCWGDINAE